MRSLVGVLCAGLACAVLLASPAAHSSEGVKREAARKLAQLTQWERVPNTGGSSSGQWEPVLSDTAGPNSGQWERVPSHTTRSTSSGRDSSDNGVGMRGDPEMGPGDAPVTIVEFMDFECPYCRAEEPTLRHLRSKYAGSVRFIHMDFPLSRHQNAMVAALAARCADEQGQFWPYHDALLAGQQPLSVADLKELAERLGLNSGSFDSCLDGRKYEDVVRADKAEGERYGVRGTPAFLINNHLIYGAQSFSQLEELIAPNLR
jgi:predicted DsbA family dithiol-disulfide isomerase